MATSRRRVLTLTGAALGAGWLAACAAPRPRATPAAPIVPTHPMNLLFLATTEGLRVVETRTRTPDYTVPGSSSPDATWTRLHTTAPAGAAARLATLDALTGKEVAGQPLPLPATARVVSASGRRVALVASAADADPRRPARTTLLIADTTGARPPHRLVLEGRYEPEAFSATDEQLFLIHYLSEGTGHYRVRVCDLATGTVGPLLTRAKSPVPVAAEEEMEGDGRQAVLAPDRSRLYTLYTHQGEHRHTRDLLAGRAARAGIHAFVHVLSLTEGWAFCLDLPLPFGRGPAAGHTLALDPTGQHLFVADASSGHVARASTTELTLARVAEVGGLPADPAAAARVTPDGARLLVAAGRSLLAIDTTSMAIERTWPLADAARGLALGAGGGLAFVGQADAVGWYDLASGRQVGHLPAPGLETIHHVARLAR